MTATLPAKTTPLVSVSEVGLPPAAALAREPEPPNRGASQRAWLIAVLVTARPRQWIKNVLVFSVPAAAGSLFIPSIGFAALVAALSFCLASSATYFFNDAQDVVADRQHSMKQTRPVAAGALSVRHAKLFGLLTGLVALATAGLVNPACLGVVAGYLLLTIGYSMKLKKVPVLEVLVVAAGFVIRAAAGAAATGVAMSMWFLLVAMFGSLYLVLGKRSSELDRTLQGQTLHRNVLAEYTSSWINQSLVMALTATVVSYALWALQYVGKDFSAPLLAVSLLPFLAGIMRYSLLVSVGGAERPEVVLTTDRFLLIAGTIWVAVLGGGLYLA